MYNGGFPPIVDVFVIIESTAIVHCSPFLREACSTSYVSRV